MRLSQLNSVFLLFELLNSFTVILLLPNSIDTSTVIHLHYLTAKKFYFAYSVIYIQFYGYQISM